MNKIIEENNSQVFSNSGISTPVANSNKNNQQRKFKMKNLKNYSQDNFISFLNNNNYLKKMSSAEKQATLQKRQINFNNNNDFTSKFLKNIDIVNQTSSKNSIFKQKSLQKNFSHFLQNENTNRDSQVQIEQNLDEGSHKENDNESDLSQLFDQDVDEKTIADEIFSKIFDDYKPKITTFFEKDLIRELSNLQANVYIKQLEIDKKNKQVSQQLTNIKNQQQQIEQLNKKIGEFYELQRQNESQIKRLDRYIKDQDELYKQIKGMLSLDIVEMEKKVYKKFQKKLKQENIEFEKKQNDHHIQVQLQASPRKQKMSQSSQAAQLQAKQLGNQKVLQKLNTMGNRQIMKSSRGIGSATKIMDIIQNNQQNQLRQSNDQNGNNYNNNVIPSKQNSIVSMKSSRQIKVQPFQQI